MLFEKKLQGQMTKEEREEAAQELCAEMLEKQDKAGMVLIPNVQEQCINRDTFELSASEDEDSDHEGTQPVKKRKSHPNATATATATTAEGAARESAKKMNANQAFKFTAAQNENFEKVFAGIIAGNLLTSGNVTPQSLHLTGLNQTSDAEPIQDSVRYGPKRPPKTVRELLNEKRRITPTIRPDYQSFNQSPSM